MAPGVVMKLENTLLAGLVLVLLLAPLPFGSVRPLAASVLALACLGLAIAWMVGRSRSGRPCLPWRDPVLVAGILLVFLGFLQIVPLPRSALEVVSPHSVEIRDRYEPEQFEAASNMPERIGAASDWRPLSFHPWATRQSLLRLLALVLLALMVIDLLQTRRARRILALALVCVGSFQAAYGLFEYFSDRQHIFAYEKIHYTDMATGTFINRNHFAGLLELTLPMAVALGVSLLPVNDSRPGSRMLKWVDTFSRREIFFATLFLLLGTTMVTALICSGSRMGFAGGLISLLWLGSYSLRGRRGKGFGIAVLLVIGATLLLLAVGGNAPAIDRFQRAGADLGGEFGRLTIWGQVLDLTGSFPVFGVGWGGFRYLFPMFRSTGDGVLLSHAHNDYLEFAAESGAVGWLLLFGGGLFLVRSRSWRAGPRTDFGFLGPGAAAGLIALAFHSLTDFNMSIPSNALVVAVLTGMLIAWKRATSPSLAGVSVGTRLWWLRAAVPVLLVGIAAGEVLSTAVGEVRRSIDPSYGEVAGWKAGRLPGAVNPDLLFRNASRIGSEAVEDLVVLLQAEEMGSEPGSRAAWYVSDRLGTAIRFQVLGLHELPTSAPGHLRLGYLRYSHCTALNLQRREQADCTVPARSEIEKAVELDPVSEAIREGAKELLAALLSGQEKSVRNKLALPAAAAGEGGRR